MGFLNKKGISPLIATVLLIGFTVALAAVVITWGSGFVQRITTGTEDRTTRTVTCTSDVNFEITKVDCNTKAVTITNTGDFPILGFTFRFFNSGGDYLGMTNGDGANKFEVKIINLQNIPSTTSKVEALSTIILEGQNVTCKDIIKEKIFSPAC